MTTGTKDEQELKEKKIEDKRQHVFTFSYSLGSDPSGGQHAHVLAKNEGEAKLLLQKHIEARHGKGPAPVVADPKNPKARDAGHVYDRAHYRISSGTVAVGDVITADTPLPGAGAEANPATNLFAPNRQEPQPTQTS